MRPFHRRHLRVVEAAFKSEVVDVVDAHRQEHFQPRPVAVVDDHRGGIGARFRHLPGVLINAPVRGSCERFVVPSPTGTYFSHVGVLVGVAMGRRPEVGVCSELPVQRIDLRIFEGGRWPTGPAPPLGLGLPGLPRPVPLHRCRVSTCGPYSLSCFRSALSSGVIDGMQAPRLPSREMMPLSTILGIAFLLGLYPAHPPLEGVWGVPHTPSRGGIAPSALPQWASNRCPGRPRASGVASKELLEAALDLRPRSVVEASHTKRTAPGWFPSRTPSLQLTWLHRRWAQDQALRLFVPYCFASNFM